MSSVIDVATTTLDRPPVLDDTALLGHPRGLGLLFMVEMWERFSYYGMRALLVLYLVNYLHWGVAGASKLYGTYTALVYLTPLIGGYLADRFIGTRRSLVIGGIIIACGHFALAFESMPTFYLGLALIIIGTGFFKPNVSTMVGQIYRDNDDRRDSGFTIFYMGINLGAALAPIVCGYLGQNVGWRYGFAAAGVGMVLGLITYLWGVNKYLPGIGLTRKDPNNAAAVAAELITTEHHIPMMPGIIGAAIGALIAFLANGGWLGAFFGIMSGATFGFTFFGTKGEERKRVIALFLVFFFVIFFWMAYEQAGSSMTIFADQHTRLQFGSFTFPSSWFQAINPIFILALAPVFAGVWTGLTRKGGGPSTTLKMVLGLVFLSLGFVLMVFAGGFADHGLKVSPLWLTGAYLLHTCGELCLSPVGLSYVTKVAPFRFASLLMGGWFLANAAANWLAGNLAALTEKMANHQQQFFEIFVVTSLGAAIAMFLIVPLLKRLTKSVNA
jgi:POT family proton-dependent oligopeptide transporter